VALTILAHIHSAEKKLRQIFGFPAALCATAQGILIHFSQTIAARGTSVRWMVHGCSKVNEEIFQKSQLIVLSRIDLLSLQI